MVPAVEGNLQLLKLQEMLAARELPPHQPAVACLRNEETRETYVEELYFRQNGYSFPGTEHGYCAVTEI